MPQTHALYCRAPKHACESKCDGHTLQQQPAVHTLPSLPLSGCTQLLDNMRTATHSGKAFSQLGVRSGAWRSELQTVSAATLANSLHPLAHMPSHLAPLASARPRHSTLLHPNTCNLHFESWKTLHATTAHSACQHGMLPVHNTYTAAAHACCHTPASIAVVEARGADRAPGLEDMQMAADGLHGRAAVRPAQQHIAASQDCRRALDQAPRHMPALHAGMWMPPYAKGHAVQRGCSPSGSCRASGGLLLGWRNNS